MGQEKYFTFQPRTKFHAMSPFCLRISVVGPCAPNHTVQNQAHVTKLLDPRPGMLTWATLTPRDHLAMSGDTFSPSMP